MEKRLSHEEWEDFISHPATKEFLKIVDERLKISRDELEAGVMSEEGADGAMVAKVIPFEDIRFIQGECKTLRWIQTVFTRFGELLKEREELEEKEREEKGE